MGFKLASSHEHDPYALAVGPSNQFGDTFGYNAVCQKVVSEEGWSVVWNAQASTTYAYKDRDWLTFENERSAREKAHYARESGLAGVMAFAFHADDYLGECGGGRYPLINAMRGALFQ